MAKTKLKKPFASWISRDNGDLMRYAEPGIWISVGTAVYVVKTYQQQNPPLYKGSDLIDALCWAETYIKDNYEVAKSDSERLADAEAEIVTLKGRVKELEEPKPTPKFQIGQEVRIRSGIGSVLIDDISVSTGSGFVYRIGTAWYSERELVPA